MAPTLAESTTESFDIADFVINQGNGVKESVCEAAEKFGFFQLVNHGVPLEVLEGVKDATHRFFGLPAAVKRKYSKELSPSNSVRFGDCLEYMKKSEILCKKLLTALMERLNLTVGGRHSDVSSTFLLQDEIGGLYVRVNEGKGEEDGWVHVPPIEGSLVINVGDALQILSNGRYRSVEHCVIASGSKNRISIPVFVNPKPSDVIGPLPEVLAAGEKPKYKNILTLIMLSISSGRLMMARRLWSLLKCNNFYSTSSYHYC
ncbi:hypothetical protein GH714_007926 [Hevea brasiliensis]|uniref:Fe2OG dioxygenase domain-containing protein n=1 Tax=Hevea brasiliensis TaxID=3981 RepID=A0A6A6KYM8_HEVBR|nr:hypothetical protein GH714_007926 [Hevea brasiliensis]